MSRRRIALALSACLAAGLVVLAVVPVRAQESAPTADAQAVQDFINKAAEPCRTQPAQACVDLGWQFAVSDPSKGLSEEDLVTLRRKLGEWYGWRQNDLPASAKSTVAMGILLADGLGMQQLHSRFDTDHNGYVSQKELLADVKLDQRPLGEVLRDPNAVDRQSLAQRLGIPLVMLQSLFP